MYCQLENKKLYYEQFGEGKLIIILHPWSLDSQSMIKSMEPIFEECSSKWQRIYLDLPGMGKTKSEKWIRNSDDMLKVTIEFIDKLIPNQNFSIIGQSYGGYIARGILYHRIEFVDGILLIAPKIHDKRSRNILPEYEVISKDDDFLKTINHDDYLNEFKSLFVVQNEQTWKRFKEEILVGAKLADLSFLKLVKENGHFFSFEVDNLERIFEKPISIITGRNDSITGYQGAWELLKNYSRVSFTLLDMAGHYLQIENEKGYNILVKEWLYRLSKIVK